MTYITSPRGVPCPQNIPIISGTLWISLELLYFTINVGKSFKHSKSDAAAVLQNFSERGTHITGLQRTMNGLRGCHAVRTILVSMGPLLYGKEGQNLKPWEKKKLSWVFNHNFKEGWSAYMAMLGEVPYINIQKYWPQLKGSITDNLVVITEVILRCFTRTSSSSVSSVIRSAS